MYQQCIDLLASRGVQVEDIIDLVIFLQKQYIPDLDKQRGRVLALIKDVIDKREVQNTIMTGIELDKAAENHAMSDKQLEEILNSDAPLYGIDEVLAYSICNIYGSIALTNFGYIDKVKPGIIGRLNGDKSHCNCFIDDIIGAIAASAASKLAHTNADEMAEAADA